MKKIIVICVSVLLISATASAATVRYTGDFEDGTTEDWGGGSVSSVNGEKMFHADGDAYINDNSFNNTDFNFTGVAYSTSADAYLRILLGDWSDSQQNYLEISWQNDRIDLFNSGTSGDDDSITTAGLKTGTYYKYTFKGNSTGLHAKVGNYRWMQVSRNKEFTDRPALQNGGWPAYISEYDYMNTASTDSTAEVSGIVEDSSDNTRIEGATVKATNSTGDVVATDTTNSNGEYSVNVTEGEEYTFEATKKSYERETHTQTVSGDVLLDFSLDPIIVDGRVVDTSGSGVSDATVEFRDGYGSVVKATTTNATGFYEVQISNDTYEVNATKSMYTANDITYTVNGSGTVNDIEIEAKGVLNGTITDLDDYAIENVTVEVYENGTLVDSTKSDVNGNFSMNVTNGDYTVEFTKDFYHPYSENISVSGNYDMGKIRLEAREYDLTMQVSPYMNYSDTQELTVRFNDNDVTDNVTITITDTFENYTIVEYYANNRTLIATSNESLAGRVNVNASYDAGDKIVYVDQNVTVAPITMENVEILSPLYSVFSVLDNQRMQYVFFVVIAGVGAAITTSIYGGMAMMIIAIIGGWIAGFIGLGLVLASLFSGMFIMMNTEDPAKYGGFRK